MKTPSSPIASASRVTAACALLSLLCSCSTVPDRMAGSSGSPSLPAEVAMNTGAGRGDILYLTLHTETGKELLFAVDTGSSITMGGEVSAQADVFGVKDARFKIDTGAPHDLILKARLCKPQLRRKEPANPRTMPGYVEEVAFGEETYINVFLTKCPLGIWLGHQNLLGLRFLGRHLVTLNFPKQTMDLQRQRVGPLPNEGRTLGWWERTRASSADGSTLVSRARRTCQSLVPGREEILQDPEQNENKKRRAFQRPMGWEPGPDQTDGLQTWVRGARIRDNRHHTMSPARNRAMFSLGARGLVLCALLAAVLASWVLFHSRIHRSLALRLLLQSQNPRDELFQELAGEFADPGDFLKACWATGKIPHRQLVASFLRANAGADPAWFGEVDPLVLGGTIDADMSVREMALATLQMRQDPRLFDQAEAQLKDPDPLVRQLGLDYLRAAAARRGVPAVMPLLDDPDLRVVARAEAALTRWTGEDFGVRMRLAIHPREGDRDQAAERADEQKIREGVARRKQWWSQHATEFPKTPGGAGLIPSVLRKPVEDFSLRDPAGHLVRLADFHGKVVILNFWATWCTACLAEIPDLAALHKKMGERIAVIGVALDGLPDEHHHESAKGNESEEHGAGQPLEAIRKKVATAVRARGINYPVLLDPSGAVGGCFNGGELPTTVILDATGHVRRRFVGERNLAVFEAMVDEASK